MIDNGSVLSKHSLNSVGLKLSHPNYDCSERCGNKLLIVPTGLWILLRTLLL